MKIQTVSNAIGLVKRIFDTDQPTLPCIEFKPEKPPFINYRSYMLPRAVPEDEGVSSKLLCDYLTELSDDRTLNMHGVTVARNGKIICEAQFGAYDPSVWHVTYSACKSITGLAIGMLCDDGLIDVDTPIVKILDKEMPKLSELTMRSVTVKNLLNMTSGVDFNEAGAVTETDWVHCYSDHNLPVEAGKAFSYNSMNTYMLSAIVKKVSEKSLTEFLKERLFTPLGIGCVGWEKCPNGIEKGGWGMYIRREDLLKIGMLVLNGGVYDGKRIVSESWISEATKKQSQPQEWCGDFDYGYQIWTGRDSNTFLFNGMFGQNVYGFKDSGIVICSNAGNGELFQQSAFFRITKKYFDGAFENKLLRDYNAEKQLEKCLKKLRETDMTGVSFADKIRIKRGLLPKDCAGIIGKRYRIREGEGASVGLMPLVMQIAQNNYTSGIAAISFCEDNGTLCMEVFEKDAYYRLPVGFGEHKKCEADFKGEKYVIAVSARFAKDEDERPALIMRISFIEHASERILRMYFEKDFSSVTVKWSETPDCGFITRGLEDVKSDFENRQIISAILKKTNKTHINQMLRASFEPETVLDITK